MSVKVAVRVRPFNQREKDNNSILCIDMVLILFILRMVLLPQLKMT